MASGDWINHAVLTAEELSASLGKLVGAELVRIFEDWTFELTDDGESLWSGPGPDLQGRLDAVVDDLSVLEPGRARVDLPPAVLAVAVEAYRDSV